MCFPHRKKKKGSKPQHSPPDVTPNEKIENIYQQLKELHEAIYRLQEGHQGVYESVNRNLNQIYGELEHVKRYGCYSMYYPASGYQFQDRIIPDGQ